LKTPKIEKLNFWFTFEAWKTTHILQERKKIPQQIQKIIATNCYLKAEKRLSVALAW
jgi:hypothetical protein